MEIVLEFYANRHWIGMVLILVVLYWLWQEFKKAAASFSRSNQAFQASNKPLPAEDLAELGAEGFLRPELFEPGQK